eukprot:UN24107
MLSKTRKLTNIQRLIRIRPSPNIYRYRYFSQTQQMDSGEIIRTSASALNENIEQFPEFLAALTPEAIVEIRKQMLENEELQITTKPSQRQLWLTGVQAGIPFVGFGFLDNLLMILFGEFIEYNLGHLMGISIMCAAACGNVFSDCAGVLSGEYVEHLAQKFNIEKPNLSEAQKNMFSTRAANSGGCGIGSFCRLCIGNVPPSVYGH